MDLSAKKKWNLLVRLNVFVALLLIATLAGLVWMWKPWNTSAATGPGKITITGSASVKAEPDQFQFNPTYSRDTTAEITKLNDGIVKTLKSLGVADADIKNNASRYKSPDVYYKANGDDGKEHTFLNLTVIVGNKDLAKKVQDYLVTTNPTGSITPLHTFSSKKQKELQDKVRGQAIDDAKKKAESTATTLGSKIGKVIEVKEGSTSKGGCGSGSDCVTPVQDMSAPESDKGPSIQPGSDEFTYNVTVVYQLD